MNFSVPSPVLASLAQEPVGLESIKDLIISGGPLMIPIGLCSVLAVAYASERWIRLRPGYLGTAKFGRSVIATAQDSGPEQALELCKTSKATPLSRILAAGLQRADAPFLDREKAVEDTAASEVKRLGSNLRPLLLVWLIAPLLGLLGTVWGMINAFSEIAGEGMGNPELLAAGIYQALTTTAAGLAVSIPAIVMHHYLKGRIEGFSRRSEDLYREVDELLMRRSIA